MTNPGLANIPRHSILEKNVKMDFQYVWSGTSIHFITCNIHTHWPTQNRTYTQWSTSLSMFVRPYHVDVCMYVCCLLKFNMYVCHVCMSCMYVSNVCMYAYMLRSRVTKLINFFLTYWHACKNRVGHCVCMLACQVTKWTYFSLQTYTGRCLQYILEKNIFFNVC